MRRARNIRSRERRRRNALLDLDITSLLDILVIILVFLLKSTNSSGIIINPAKEIILPQSKTGKVQAPALALQVSKNKVWLDDKLILDQNLESNFEGRKLITLYDELIKKREELEIAEDLLENEEKFEGKLSLMVHKEISYEYLQKILYTAGEAGFVQFQFVVLDEERS